MRKTQTQKNPIKKVWFVNIPNEVRIIFLIITKMVLKVLSLLKKVFIL